jgi:hypothetical protein
MTVGESPSSSWMRRWLAPTRIGIVLIAIMALVLAGRFALAIGPLNGAQAYCHDLMSQKYDDVYASLLTSGARAQTTQALFMHAESLADDTAGVVQRCDMSLLSVDFGFGSGKVHIIEQRANGVTINEALQMVDNGAHISVLPNLPLKPLAAGQGFCDAMIRQDYGVAYQQLAPSIQSGLSQSLFSQLAQQADQSNGLMDACTISRLELSTDSATADLSATTHRHLGGSSNAAIPFTVARQNDGTWKITKMPSF